MLTRFLYTLAFYLAIPLLLIRLGGRIKKNPAYRGRIRERFGFYSCPPQQGSLWFHTVSVGEFLASKPLIDRVLAAHPDKPCVITTMTPTGSEQVLSSYADQIKNGRMHHVYLPYDLPDAIKRFLNRFHPALLVIMETELWPNLIHFTHQRNVPILVANARLSEKSAEGYRKILPLFRPMMREVSLVAAQSQEDGERFTELGLLPANLEVTGTVKFDLEVDSSLQVKAQQLREAWGTERHVVIAASTHRGEDELVLEAFLYIRAKQPGSLLVMVPRHPERFDDVAKLISRRGLSSARISEGEQVSPETEVLLGDTMGDLLRMLGAADVAFIGGSLVPVGGHNMLEPLAMGTPAITGPHVFNFQMVAELLSQQNVLVTVNSPLALGEVVVDLFEDRAKRIGLSQRGKRIVDENRGAVDRLFQLIQSTIG